MFDATTAQRLTTDGDWFAPYFISLGYRLGNVLVLSGQASISEQGEIVGAGDFDAQAAQTFANIERVLGLGGAGLEDIFKVTIYLTDMAHFPKIMELRQRHFTPPYPADTIVEVRSLALPELMIEIEVMAMVPDGERRVIDAIVAEAVGTVFKEYVDEHGLPAIAEAFAFEVERVIVAASHEDLFAVELFDPELFAV